MTVSSKTRRTFTRNNFAEHNYNYAHSSQTNYPPRKNNNNQIRSQYWDNPMATTNSVNFKLIHILHRIVVKITHSFNRIKIKSKHLIKRIIYPLMMIIYNQIYLHHILKNIVDKECRNHIHIIELFLHIQQIHKINNQYKCKTQLTHNLFNQFSHKTQ